MPTEKIRVLIAEDNPSLARRYEAIIRNNANIEVVASSNSGYEAVLLCALHKPDVILMDIEMESREAGILASREILAKFPSVRIIILTVYEDDKSVFNAFKAGVTDYLLKNAGQEEIVRSIEDAYHGCSPIRPIIAEKIRREFKQMKRREDSFLYYQNWLMKLSESEIDILLLLAQGESRRQICQKRHVELTTVKTQIRNILHKLKFQHIQEALDVVRDPTVLEILKQAQVKE